MNKTAFAYVDGRRIKGVFSTTPPVFIKNNKIIPWEKITDIIIPSGKPTSEKKQASSRENGKLGGRPRRDRD